MAAASPAATARACLAAGDVAAAELAAREALQGCRRAKDEAGDLDVERFGPAECAWRTMEGRERREVFTWECPKWVESWKKMVESTREWGWPHRCITPCRAFFSSEAKAMRRSCWLRLCFFEERHRAMPRGRASGTPLTFLCGGWYWILRLAEK